MFTRARLFWAGLLAGATTAVLVGAPAMVQADITARAIDGGGAEMFTRARLWPSSRPTPGRCSISASAGPRRGRSANGIRSL
jgi:hypothetical protein